MDRGFKIFLKALSSEMPKLRSMIVAFGELIVMERDLTSCLERLFGRGKLLEGTALPGTSPDIRIRDLASKSYNTTYNRAEQFLKQAEWARYGEKLKARLPTCLFSQARPPSWRPPGRAL